MELRKDPMGRLPTKPGTFFRKVPVARAGAAMATNGHACAPDRPPPPPALWAPEQPASLLNVSDPLGILSLPKRTVEVLLAGLTCPSYLSLRLHPLPRSLMAQCWRVVKFEDKWSPLASRSARIFFLTRMVLGGLDSAFTTSATRSGT